MFISKYYTEMMIFIAHCFCLMVLLHFFTLSLLVIITLCKFQSNITQLKTTVDTKLLLTYNLISSSYFLLISTSFPHVTTGLCHKNNNMQV